MIVKPLVFTNKGNTVEANTALGLIKIQSYIKGKSIYWTQESACSNDYYIINGDVQDAMDIVEQAHQEAVLGWLNCRLVESGENNV